MIGLDEPVQAGSDDRDDALVEAVVGLLVLAPVGVLGRAEEVLRVRKRRHPLAADQHRVPSDMIEVQMCADDRVDGQPVEARIRQRVRMRRAHHADAGEVVIVAEARVDDDLLIARTDRKRMDRDPQQD